jgi:hypothetical protein
VRLELGKGDAPTVSRGSKPINPPITNPLKRFNKESAGAPTSSASSPTTDR